MCWDVRQPVLMRLLGGGELAIITSLICPAIRDSMPVTPHISANLTNSIIVVMISSGVDSPKTTRPRHSHCDNIRKLRVETTPSTSSKVVDWSSSSSKFPSSNVAAKYEDCLQRRAFGSIYSWLAGPMGIVT